MEEKKRIKLYGLIGRNIDYSFSKDFFKEKFKKENILNSCYIDFDINKIDDFRKLLKKEKLSGLNVTIPYKRSIIQFLDEIDDDAKKIGAVNTLVFKKNRKITGYNTDCYGFEKALLETTKQKPKGALILGTGGASAAVSYVLNKIKIPFKLVSRKPKLNQIHYEELNNKIIKNNTLIINTTPLGTYPKIENCPNIPYSILNETHYLFDLIYNPKTTLFLKKGSEKGAKIQNGNRMLIYQAEKSWELWNNI